MNLPPYPVWKPDVVAGSSSDFHPPPAPMSLPACWLSIVWFYTSHLDLVIYNYYQWNMEVSGEVGISRAEKNKTSGSAKLIIMVGENVLHMYPEHHTWYIHRDHLGCHQDDTREWAGYLWNGLKAVAVTWLQQSPFSSWQPLGTFRPWLQIKLAPAINIFEIFLFIHACNIYILHVYMQISLYIYIITIWWWLMSLEYPSLGWHRLQRASKHESSQIKQVAT